MPPVPLKLKPSERTPSFSWDDLPPPSPPEDAASLPSPPTSWLSARDMKLFGAQPLTSTSDIGLVKCNECDKPILRSFMAEHAVTCATIRSGGKKPAKGKAGFEVDDPKKGSKKRKASPSPSDPSQPPKKKTKPITKITKGRMKGPIDYDQQCGVINDKNLPCSRSLTCKSHSMGAKRAVQGRSRLYDDLLLDWQRKHNPNFVEPVKRETKAEKKEKREKEKLEKKKLAEEQAVALGVDPSLIKKQGVSGTKKGGKRASAATTVRMNVGDDDNVENLDDLDSEAEMDDLVQAVRDATTKGIIGVPLAVPCDAGTWFVQRRERLRCCRDLLVGALSTNHGNLGLGMGLTGRGSLSLGRG
ncbi:SCA7, zinc-binding domain-containing protein [Mycena pura]|uniref:SCA7, zinc-binding domain-containing protein n=1 Tax=Mycena pura TaxID=153505 RepID=A0AAD6YNA5_9AGAR|nr:SCA7, zinc-binding domain-containing protein [Mycena pura]